MMFGISENSSMEMDDIDFLDSEFFVGEDLDDDYDSDYDDDM